MSIWQKSTKYWEKTESEPKIKRTLIIIIIQKSEDRSGAITTSHQ